MMLSFESPTSSDIQSASYETDSQTLIILFRRNQKTYVWSGVPIALWHGFVEAPSQGRFFHQMIKGKFSFATNFGGQVQP